MQIHKTAPWHVLNPNLMMIVVLRQQLPLLALLRLFPPRVQLWLLGALGFLKLPYQKLWAARLRFDIVLQ